MKQPFQLAVSDIDGTLAIIGEPVSQDNLQAIRRLQENGIEFVLASGRHHENMLPFCEAIPEVNWIISAQGGMVANRDMTEVLYCGFLEKAVAEQLILEGKRRGFTILTYTRHGVYSPDLGKWVDYYETIASNIVTRDQLDRILDLEIFKVVWIEEEALVNQAVAAPFFLPDVTGFQTHPHLYEFMPSTTSKGNAVRALAHHLGIEMAAVLTMGDGNNDVSMLEIAGCSIAMGHGSPSAVSVGRIVTPADIPGRALASGVDAFFEQLDSAN